MENADAAWHWISLGIWAFSQLTALVVIYVRLVVKIKEIEMKNSSLKESFHLHEKLNEDSMTKIEEFMIYLRDSIDELKRRK